MLVGAVLGWRWYTSSRTLEVENRSEITEQENLFIPFHNASYGYSLLFPKTWFLGYDTETSEDALTIRIVSNERDLHIVDEALPIGVHVEISVEKFTDPFFKSVDANFPIILSVQDWIAWLDTQGTKAAALAVRTNLTVAGQPAVLSVWEDPQVPVAQRARSIQFLSPDKSKVFIIHYMCPNPHYTEHLSEFEGIIKSFNFTAE